MKTKNLEVRWCDDFSERMERAREMKSTYYDDNNELLDEWQTENMYIRKWGWLYVLQARSAEKEQREIK